MLGDLNMKKIAAPVLEISNLCKKEKNKTIERLNLIVPSGDSLSVLYKNEENIELLCDILKGVKKADKGKVFFKSMNVTGLKNFFGVVEKKSDVPKTRSVCDFAAAPIVKRGLSKKMALVLVKKELAGFDLSEYGNKAVSMLPENLLRRAELFNAYMCSHELIVIDDPFFGVDEKERIAELELFERIKNSSKLSLLLFTQDIKLAVRFSDTVMVVDDNTQSVGIISVDRKNMEKTEYKISELYNSV